MPVQDTCLLKLRQYTQVLSQLLASRFGLSVAPHGPQYDLLRRRQAQGVLPPEAAIAEGRRDMLLSRESIVGRR